MWNVCFDLKTVTEERSRTLMLECDILSSQLYETKHGKDKWVQWTRKSFLHDRMEISDLWSNLTCNFDRKGSQC
jgi:hypothetical protein